jgi:hypothetical protein
MINIERGTIIRALFSLLTIHTWFCGMFDPQTVHYQITERSGFVGVVVVTLLGLLGLLALVDTVVNDMMSQNYFLKSLLGRRHLIFMAIALLYATELYVSLQFVQSWGLALYCLLMVSFLVITAFRDINYRFPGKIHA